MVIVMNMHMHMRRIIKLLLRSECTYKKTCSCLVCIGPLRMMAKIMFLHF